MPDTGLVVRPDQSRPSIWAAFGKGLWKNSVATTRASRELKTTNSTTESSPEVVSCGSTPISAFRIAHVLLSGALGRQYRDYGRAKRQFNAKHRRSLRWRQIGPPVLTVLLAGTILVSIWAPIALLFPATYAISLVAVGLTSKRSPVPVAIALATMHLSWGLGFLRGGRG